MRTNESVIMTMKPTILDTDNLSSRKLWELLSRDSSLNACDKQRLACTLRNRRHYEKELDALQCSNHLIH